MIIAKAHRKSTSGTRTLGRIDTVGFAALIAGIAIARNYAPYPR